MNCVSMNRLATSAIQVYCHDVELVDHKCFSHFSQSQNEIHGLPCGNCFYSFLSFFSFIKLSVIILAFQLFYIRLMYFFSSLVISKRIHIYSFKKS